MSELDEQFQMLIELDAQMILARAKVIRLYRIIMQRQGYQSIQQVEQAFRLWQTEQIKKED